MPRVAIIADDLTGALDSASPFACGGRHVRVALDADWVGEAMSTRPDVIAVSTNSRALTEDVAVSRARRAAEALLAWRPELVLKKVDSRLKGNVACETAAVAEVFGLSRLCAAVALPGEGRLVREGHLEGRGLEGRVRIAESMPCGKFSVSVADAASDDDLDRIADDWSAESGILFACTRGLTAAFARRFARGDVVRPFLARLPAIVAVGSRDPITRRQVATLLAATEQGAMVEAPGGRVSNGHASGPMTVVVCVGEVTEAQETVARRFAESIAAAASRLRPATMLLSGGDTALAVLRAIRVETLLVQGEAAAGLPWFEVTDVEGRTVATVTKSGGFGDPDILARVLTRRDIERGCNINGGHRDQEA